MALTTAQLERAWKYWVTHRAVDAEIPCRFTKAQIRDGLAAATAWIETNQASFVTSLAGTAFAGGGSTGDEKLRLFLAALAHKFDIELKD